MPADANPARRREDVHGLLREADEPLSIAQIAACLDVHPNTARFHLETLVAHGRAEAVTPTRRGPGRPAALFRAVRRMDPQGPRRYELLAEVLVDSLSGAPDVRERATRAGRSWWHHHGTRIDRTLGSHPAEPMPRLVALLDTIGFAPESGSASLDTPLRLRHCPFLELTTGDHGDRTDVVCPIHLGLMQGALEAWEADMAVERLDPLVEPDLCLAHLSITR